MRLPLSNTLAEGWQLGTRHAAALGLAERCDALVVVVSEERGTISVAQRGELQTTESAELSNHLTRYYQDRFSPSRVLAWHSGFTSNIVLKAAAISAACVLWLLFAYRVETIQRTFVVPIEYRNLRDNWVIDEPHLTRSELTLSGSERAFDMLDASNLAVSFELANVPSEVPFALQTEDHLIGLSVELRINQIRPRQVEITLRPKSPDSS